MNNLLTHAHPRVALAGPPLVRWLIGREPDVRAAVADFIRGKLPTNRIEVAGPPSDEDLAKRAKREAYTDAIPVPTIVLECKMVKHHLTGEPGCQVTVSELDFEELKSWYHRARLKALLERMN